MIVYLFTCIRQATELRTEQSLTGKGLMEKNEVNRPFMESRSGLSVLIRMSKHLEFAVVRSHYHQFQLFIAM